MFKSNHNKKEKASHPNNLYRAAPLIAPSKRGAHKVQGQGSLEGCALCPLVLVLAKGAVQVAGEGEARQQRRRVVPSSDARCSPCPRKGTPQAHVGVGCVHGLPVCGAGATVLAAVQPRGVNLLAW